MPLYLILSSVGLANFLTTTGSEHLRAALEAQIGCSRWIGRVQVLKDTEMLLEELAGAEGEDLATEWLPLGRN